MAGARVSVNISCVVGREIKPRPTVGAGQKRSIQSKREAAKIFLTQGLLIWLLAQGLELRLSPSFALRLWGRA